jgi:hypothetical protein
VNIGENIFGICLNDFKSLIPFGIYAESRSVLILRTQQQKKDCPFPDSLLPQSLIE